VVTIGAAFLFGVPIASSAVISLQFIGLRDAALNLLAGFPEFRESNLPGLSPYGRTLRL
jgi:hypothetical protein